ncbi:hypothetical protein ACEPAG_2295 [Sanghuangporus baumii]
MNADDASRSPHGFEKDDDVASIHVSNVATPHLGLGDSEDQRILEHRLVRKLDCRISMLLILNILNNIDRNNVASARLRGFESDLRLTGKEYDIVLSIFYVGYILLQVPSNMFLNHTGRPSLYLPTCVAIWGVVTILTGVVSSFTGVLLIRFFLGIIQATFFSGAVFLLSKWYTRKELGLRITFLYSAHLLGNAFGGLLASGILDGMQGKFGLPGWRWLFYIEGSLTVLIAISAKFVLPDFPTSSRWLSPEERELAMHRMAVDGGINVDDQESTGQSAPEICNGRMPRLQLVIGTLGYYGRGAWLAMRDWKIWWLVMSHFIQYWAISFFQFFPTLVASLGYSRRVALILVAPPWILTAVIALFISGHSDKRGERFFHILGPLILGIIGYIIWISSMNVVARYISLFLAAISNCGEIIALSWISSSIPRPPSKRAAAIALIYGLGQLGTFTGSYCFPSSWGPSYRASFAICLSLQILNILMCWIFRMYLKRLNDEMEEAEHAAGQQKGFRYLL